MEEERGGVRGGRLNQDYIRMQEEEEQEAKVCERERGQPRQKRATGHRAGWRGGKGRGRPAETEGDRTKSKNTNTIPQLFFNTFNWTVTLSSV